MCLSNMYICTPFSSFISSLLSVILLTVKYSTLLCSIIHCHSLIHFLTHSFFSLQSPIFSPTPPSLSLPPPSHLPPHSLLQVAASLLDPLITLIPSQQSYALASLFIIGVYQLSLSYLGLSHYLIHGAEGGGSRSGLLDANREGIVSCLGYVALYLGSVQLGRFIFKSRLVCVWCVCVYVRMCCM